LEGEAMAVLLRNGVGNPAHKKEVIETLARESDAPIDHVRELYEAEHARLESEASIKTFVSVVATRLVRKTLHAEKNAQDN
jgi:hypothetical protein